MYIGNCITVLNNYTLGGHLIFLITRYTRKPSIDETRNFNHVMARHYRNYWHDAISGHKFFGLSCSVHASVNDLFLKAKWWRRWRLGLWTNS